MTNINSNKLIISSGNDAQVPFVCRLHEQLRNVKRGAYIGRFLFISDKLSDKTIDLLKKQKIPFHLLNSSTVESLQTTFQSDKHPLGKIAKPAIIAEGIKDYVKPNDRLIYLDPDMFVQESVEPFFDMMPADSVILTAQEFSMKKTPWCLRQFMRCIGNGHLTYKDLLDIKEEINTGIMLGYASVFQQFLNQWIKFMTRADMKRYAFNDVGQDNAWHDQDYFRCFIRFQSRNNIIILPPHNGVVHLCAQGHSKIVFIPILFKFYYRKLTKPPILVHLAGAAHTRYENLIRYYDDIKQTLEHHQKANKIVRLAIYGTGGSALDTLKCLPRYTQVEAFVDDNPEQHGKLLHGVPIISAAQLADFSYDYILIACSASTVITNKLTDAGIPIQHILAVKEPLLSQLAYRKRKIRKYRIKMFIILLIGVLVGIIVSQCYFNLSQNGTNPNF